METILKLLPAACALAVVAISYPAFAQEFPFVGSWDCEVQIFTLTADTYNNGSEDLPISEVQEGTDGSYTLFLSDDYIITLSGFTDDAMGWFSPASGDNFNCVRIAD